MGYLGATISIGTVAGAGLVWAIGGFSPVLGFALIAAAAVLSFLLGVILLPEPRRHLVAEKSGAAVPFGAVWPYFTITALAMTANSIVQPVIGLRMMDQFGLEQTGAIGFAGAAVTCSGLAMMISQAIITPRLNWPPVRMLRVGGLCAALGLALLALADNQALIIVSMAIMGLSLGLVLPGNLAAMSLATGTGAQGKVAGVNTLALGVGLATGPIVGTALYRMSYGAPFWLAGALALLIAVLAVVAAMLKAPGQPLARTA
jgi:DHA1 family tetracycline resistance protein-like MFS transporter